STFQNAFLTIWNLNLAEKKASPMCASFGRCLSRKRKAGRCAFHPLAKSRTPQRNRKSISRPSVGHTWSKQPRRANNNNNSEAGVVVSCAGYQTETQAGVQVLALATLEVVTSPLCSAIFPTYQSSPTNEY